MWLPCRDEFHLKTRLDLAMKNMLRYFFFLILAIREVGCAAGMTLAQFWQRLRPLCCYCTRPVSPDSIVRGESFMWCGQCHRLSPKPLVKAPGWIFGTIGILAINAMRMSGL